MRSRTLKLLNVLILIYGKQYLRFLSTQLTLDRYVHVQISYRSVTQYLSIMLLLNVKQIYSEIDDITVHILIKYVIAKYNFTMIMFIFLPPPTQKSPAIHIPRHPSCKRLLSGAASNLPCKYQEFFQVCFCAHLIQTVY